MFNLCASNCFSEAGLQHATLALALLFMPVKTACQNSARSFAILTLGYFSGAGLQHDAIALLLKLRKAPAMFQHTSRYHQSIHEDALTLYSPPNRYSQMSVIFIHHRPFTVLCLVSSANTESIPVFT